MSNDSKIALAAAESAAASASSAATSAEFASESISEINEARTEVTTAAAAVADALSNGVGVEVVWSDVTAAQIAAAQGYWTVVSEDEPEQTEMFGVPVLWIQKNTALVPVPVNPPAPTWNDATSRFTVPADVIGVDYVWTSGGGGIGSTVTPGATLETSGDFPRRVVVTPVPQAGYALFGATSFRHDFPDPAAITLITSDAFSGPGGDFSGRLTDAALGGDERAWGDGRGNTDLLDGLVITGAGGAATKAGAANRIPSLGPDWGQSTRNLRVEWDVVSAALNGDSLYNAPLWIVLSRAGTVPPPNAAPRIEVGLGAQQLIAYTSRPDDSNVELTWDNGGAFPPAGTPLPAGHYTLQLYGNTVTFIMPNGSGGTITRTAGLNPTDHKAATEPWAGYNLLLAIYGFNTPQQIVIDNLKISRLGY